MRVWIALVVATSLAHADPTRSRIVLADPDPALRAAIERTLSPWRIEVVVEPEVPTTPAQVGELARLCAAHFVVWREGGELVVLDQRRNAIEHREAHGGSLAPADAAAAALTVKTLMRLDPPASPPRRPRLGQRTWRWSQCYDVITNPNVSPNCDLDSLADPVVCMRCTQVESCGPSECGGDTCILCPGQDPNDLPSSCGGMTECPVGSTSCAGGAASLGGTYCDNSSACCVGIIQ